MFMQYSIVLKIIFIEFNHKTTDANHPNSANRDECKARAIHISLSCKAFIAHWFYIWAMQIGVFAASALIPCVLSKHTASSIVFTPAMMMIFGGSLFQLNVSEWKVLARGKTVCWKMFSAMRVRFTFVSNGNKYIEGMLRLWWYVNNTHTHLHNRHG